MFQAWIVANKSKLSKAYDDKFFHDVVEAHEVRDKLNKEYPGNVWKVYEVSVEILSNLEEF